MATAAQMRKLIAKLPDTTEEQHMNHPDFRRGGKIFAGLDESEKTASLKLSPETQAAIVTDASGAFSPAAGAWGRSGWTKAILSLVPAGALESLLEEAWSQVTPPKLNAKKRAAAGARSPKRATSTAKKKTASKK